jgi:hypothetical protein
MPLKIGLTKRMRKGVSLEERAVRWSARRASRLPGGSLTLPCGLCLAAEELQHHLVADEQGVAGPDGPAGEAPAAPGKFRQGRQLHKGAPDLCAESLTRQGVGLCLVVSSRSWDFVFCGRLSLCILHTIVALSKAAGLRVGALALFRTATGAPCTALHVNPASRRYAAEAKHVYAHRESKSVTRPGLGCKNLRLNQIQTRIEPDFGSRLKSCNQSVYKSGRA